MDMQVQKLHFDAKLGNSACYFSGSSKPMAALERLSVCGGIILGRQVTAPPRQTRRLMPVGLYRTVEIPFTPKGSRALIKVYTNMKLGADNPRVWYGMGLEPIIGLVRLLTFCTSHPNLQPFLSSWTISQLAGRNKHLVTLSPDC